MEDDSLWAIGSVTKGMTAMLIAKCGVVRMCSKLGHHLREDF